jgi:hypothetical protein
MGLVTWFQPKGFQSLGGAIICVGLLTYRIDIAPNGVNAYLKEDDQRYPQHLFYRYSGQLSP